MTGSTTTQVSSLTPQYLAKLTFDLYQTHGVPLEVSEDIIEKKGLVLDRIELTNLIEGHQKLSQETSAGQFKSGVGSNTLKAQAMHTTTHILHKVLRDIFGSEVKQMGSAILDDKARFDINVNANELTEDKIQQISSEVQSIIDKHLAMTKAEMTEQEARNIGAIGLFGEKYGEKVTVYTLGNDQEIFSREFCGGPHINNTKEISKFEILKKKSIGNGLTRIEFDITLS
jgi:alanyl-tRNA synthetase